MRRRCVWPQSNCRDGMSGQRYRGLFGGSCSCGTKQPIRHTFVTRIVSDDVRLVYCQHKSMLHAVEQTCVTKPFHHVLVTLCVCVCVCVGVVVPLVVLYQTQNPSPLRHSPRLRRSVVLCFCSLQSGSCGLPNVCHRCIPSPIRHSCVSAGIVVPLFVSFVSVGLQVRHGACF
jgi:hypothetical protein